VNVEIIVRNIGQAFATYAEIVDAKSRQVLASTDERPFGFAGAAIADAEALAEIRGWRVVKTRR